MPARTVGLLLWLTMGGLAALALFWRIGNPPRPPTVGSALPPLELPAVAALEPFQLSPPGQYGEVAVRPLFIADRRPEPPPPDEVAPPEKPPGPEQKFMLFGVMIAPGMQAALLRLEEPNARTTRVGLGEMIGEWRLDKISADGIVLRKGEATQELPLTRPRKPGKPRMKRTGAQPGQDTVPPAPAPAPPASALIGPGGMPVVPRVDALIPQIVPGPTQ
ncbi:MAG: hypothetical protein WAV07_16190 [Candidatus Contendobacter sp.]